MRNFAQMSISNTYETYRIWGFPKIKGYHVGGPHIKDYSILGSILGSPHFGKLTYTVRISSCVYVYMCIYTYTHIHV